MQVTELANDLKVGADMLIQLLRGMGIPVHDEDDSITDGQVAKVLARVERERRAGHKAPAEDAEGAEVNADQGRQDEIRRRHGMRQPE